MGRDGSGMEDGRKVGEPVREETGRMEGLGKGSQARTRRTEWSKDADRERRSKAQGLKGEMKWWLEQRSGGRDQLRAGGPGRENTARNQGEGDTEWKNCTVWNVRSKHGAVAGTERCTVARRVGASGGLSPHKEEGARNF